MSQTTAFLRAEIMAGTDRQDAVQAVWEIAKGLNCPIAADFNGVEIFARPTDEIDDLQREFEHDYRLETQYPKS